jgi:hypothetical protein
MRPTGHELSDETLMALLRPPRDGEAVELQRPFRQYQAPSSAAEGLA